MDPKKLDEALDRAQPHEYISLIIGTNTKHLLSELRLIKWILLIILIMLFSIANQLLPSGWLYKPWWG